jgi:hypothetical protein
MKLKKISCDECKDGHYHSNEGRSFARQCHLTLSQLQMHKNTCNFASKKNLQNSNDN